MALPTWSPTAQNDSIGVASRLQVHTDVAGELFQICHGKKEPLHRSDAHDRLVMYEPRPHNPICESLQAIAVAGHVETDEVYQFEATLDFEPSRFEICFEDCYVAPIMPRIYMLSFFKSDQFGTFRFGSLTVPGHRLRIYRRADGFAGHGW